MNNTFSDMFLLILENKTLHFIKISENLSNVLIYIYIYIYIYIERERERERGVRGAKILYFIMPEIQCRADLLCGKGRTCLVKQFCVMVQNFSMSNFQPHYASWKYIVKYWLLLIEKKLINYLFIFIENVCVLSVIRNISINDAPGIGYLLSLVYVNSKPNAWYYLEEFKLPKMSS